MIMKKAIWLLVIVLLFTVYCSKENKTCGKITNVTVFAQPSRTDTVTVTLKVEFSSTDIRDFALLRNKKAHTNDFWYAYIGKQHCIGDNYPD
jgi:hypothetical protein